MTGQESTPADAPRPRLGRRDLLRGVATTGLGAGIGVSAGLLGSRAAIDGPSRSDLAGTWTDPTSVSARGAHQAGIVRPDTPQPHGLLLTLDLADVPPPGPDAGFVTELRRMCADIGNAVAGVTTGTSSEEVGLMDPPGDLTVTVGLGPRLVAAVDPALPGAEDLPSFMGDDDIPPHRRGGDLLIAVYGSDPIAIHETAYWLARRVPHARIRWGQRCFRSPGSGTIARNPLGFHDGVIVPRTGAELDEHVWLQDGPLAGGTICVIRRLRLDTAAFHAQPLSRQEQVIGRRKRDGSPLSGGAPTDEVNLQAKRPDGSLLTPAESHVRAAHPSFTDSHLMLRRGYAYDDGALVDGSGTDSGLMFVCFQRDLRTFVQTQHRLDETDSLMRFVTPTGSATFLILPGFDENRPLGSTLPRH